MLLDEQLLLQRVLAAAVGSAAAAVGSAAGAAGSAELRLSCQLSCDCSSSLVTWTGLAAGAGAISLLGSSSKKLREL